MKKNPPGGWKKGDPPGKRQDEVRAARKRGEQLMLEEQAHYAASLPSTVRGYDRPFDFNFPVRKADHSDPIQAYMLRQAHHYCMGRQPDGTKLATPEQLMAEISQRTERVVYELFSEGAYDLAAMLGMERHAFRNGVYPQKIKHMSFCRAIQTGLLVHICNVREYLNNLERELWVTMQLAHDERLQHRTPADIKNARKYREMRQRKQDAGEPARSKRTIRLPALVMPVRLINEINTALDEATEKMLATPTGKLKLGPRTQREKDAAAALERARKPRRKVSPEVTAWRREHAYKMQAIRKAKVAERHRLRNEAKAAARGINTLPTESE